MRKLPNVGDKIVGKGYKVLPFVVAQINKTHRQVLTYHPLTGEPFWWNLREIELYNNV